MKLSNREIKKRAKLKKIVEWIYREGFVLAKDIEHNLDIPHATLHGYLRELSDIGIIKEYNKDGKSGWARIDYTEEEDKIKTAYEKLRENFFGEPPLKAVAIEVNETPEKTTELLSRHTSYREPSKIEMEESAREIERYLLWKCWIDQKLNERNFKKWGLERGIEKLLCSGIDCNNFSNLINRQNMPPIDKVLDYSKNSPEVVVMFDQKIEGSIMHYNFLWSKDARTIFKILGGKLKPWDEKGQIPLPRKLDNNKYNKYKGSLDRSGYALDRIKDLAGFSVPDDQALEDCLDWLKNPDSKNRREVLSILRSFCMNARGCEAIAPEKEEAILETLANIAFGKDVEEKLRWESLNIIKIFDGEKVKERAKKYCLEKIKKECESVNYLSEIALWLYRNPEIEREIKEEVEQILMESNDEKIKLYAENFLKTTRSLQSAGLFSLNSGERGGGA